MKKTIAIYLFMFFLSGCVEEFDLDLDQAEPRLVVEGLITNQPGPYYIRLTESHTGGLIKTDHSPTGVDSAKAVMNAQIIIYDDAGQIDTLVPIDVDINEYDYDPLGGYYKLVYDNAGNIIDTLFLTDPSEFRHDRGFYKTQHFVGIPGRTYFITIRLKGKEYIASDYMHPIPDIDSLGYMKKIREKDGQEYYIPLLYFSEPQGIDNFYLIQLDNEVFSRGWPAAFSWRFSILSDEYLQPYVNGLNVSLGENPGGIEYDYYWQGATIYLALSSLSKNAYEFYRSLLQQFKNDGGAYKPCPASPPTNISNGGLGYFRASAISESEVQIPFTFK